MAIDFSKPLLTDTYASIVPALQVTHLDIARWLEPTLTGAHTSLPTGAIRINAANATIERYSGTWGALQFKVGSGTADTGNFTTLAASSNLSSGTRVDAPIYYDSNNTGYYADPSATSSFLGLTVVNTITGSVSGNAGTVGTYNAAQLMPYMSGRDFPAGTLITTSIDYSGVNGDSFLLEIEGNSYGSLVPFLTKVQGYIYSSTIINAGIFSSGSNIPGIIALNVGGVLCFWFPTMGYWQGFNVFAMSTMGGGRINKVVSVVNSAKPTGTKEYAFTYYYGLTSLNYASYAMPLAASAINTVDVRAPIFYDYNNTGYYLDPASTSNLNIVTTAGSITAPYLGVSNTSGSTGYGLSLYGGASAGTPTYGIMFQQTASFGTYGSVSGDWATYFTMNNVAGRGWVFRDVSTPANVAAISNGGILSLAGSINTINGYTPLSGAIRLTPNLHLNATAGYAVIVNWDSNTTGAAQTFRVGNGASADVFYVRADGYSYLTGYMEAGGSFRAPLFYDNNNTAFYVDPASTSNFGTIIVNSGIYLNKTASVASGISFYSSSFTAWAMYMANATTTGNGPTANITAPTGTYVTTWGLRSFIENTAGYGWTWEGGTTSGQPSVVAELSSATGIFRTSGSFRAPIFYDQDNTAYYTDPASTSNLNGLTVAAAISGSVTGYSKYFPTNYIGGAQLNPQTYFNNGVGLNVAMTAAAGTWTDTLWINGYSGADVPNMIALHTSRQATPRMWISTQSNLATAYGTMYEFAVLGYNAGNSNGLYAGILYDTNNTAYYDDPSGTSNFNGLTTNTLTMTCAGNTATFNATTYFYSSNAGGAMFAFHRGGYYAVNMGLDSDNVIRIGGWSAAVNRWQLDMSGNMYAAGNITAYSSDSRLKKNVRTIPSPIELVKQLRGVYFDWEDFVDDLGFSPVDRSDIGVIAQEYQKVIPQGIKPAPFDTGLHGESVSGKNYLTVQLEKAIPILIEAIKAQQEQIDELKKQIYGKL